MTLTATIIALLGLLAWSLTLTFLLVSQRGLLVLTGKMRVNAFAPDGNNMPSDFGLRLLRARANCFENLPLQTGVLLYVIAAQQTALTDQLAGVLLGARLFQSVMHLLSTSPLFVWLRFIGYFTQLLILAYWLLLLSNSI